MKYLLTWVIVAAAALLGPRPAAAQAESTATKYWVYFVDRGAWDPSVRYVVTPEALARRARRGTGAPSSTDYHVSTDYVAALQQLGVQPIVESRWMNAVSALLTEAQRQTVAELKFVDRLVPVGRGGRPASEFESSALTRATHSSAAAMDIVSERLTGVDARFGRSLFSNNGTAALDYGASETQLSLVNAIPPLEAGINGAGVILGFLDASFLGLDHPALQHLHMDRRAELRNFTGREQSDSHGLSVVSVAAGYAPGELIGPAYGAHILGATTEYAPSETNAEEDYFVAGLEWLEAMGADVVSASIGYTTFDPGQKDYTPEDLDGDTGITTRAADRAVALGITFVAAAGNQGCSSPRQCWYYVGTPADGDSVIAVGAVTSSGSRSAFSSLGPTADGRIKPDVAAQGSAVYLATPDGQYAFSRGTSFAAPMVSGIVAQMLQANPSLRPMEVRDILRQTASQAENPDSALGWGIVDAAAAVQIAIDLGADEIPSSEALEVQAYPNPATDYVFIDINARALHRQSVRVYDVLGRSVDLQALNVRYPSLNLVSLETASLPGGVYFYTIDADAMRAGGTFVVVR